MAKKKTKVFLRVNFILGFAAFFILGAGMLFSFQNIPKQILYKKLQECPGHKKGNIHYHATLTIFYLGEKMTIPAGIGLEGDCIHPVHTHDETNLVHVDYPSEYPFTLGDFFNTWGYIYNKDQFANIRTFDGYEILMDVNGGRTNQYEKYVIRDGDKITITVKKKSGD